MGIRIHIKLGDVFQIPLPDRRWAVCQYVFRSQELGFLVRVFDLLTFEPVSSLEVLKERKNLFPPVFVGLQASARSGRWQRIGNFGIGFFEHPEFRQTMGTKPGVYDDWRVWDGFHTRKIGKLPEELRSLELKCIWGDEALEQRI